MKGVKQYQINHAILGDFPEPRLIHPEDVKIRVHYCSINADDYAMYTGRMKGKFPDNGILSEFSGVIASVGEVSRRAGFSVGDPVSATFYYPCGMCPMCRRNRPDLCLELITKPVLNEYIVLNNRAVVHLPRELPLRHGALFWLAARCMQGVERLNVCPGDTVLIHGGGNVGMMILQLLRAKRPRLIVVSEPIASKRVLAKKMGADVVLDPGSDNLAEKTLQLTEGFGFNHIVDAAGTVKIMPDTVNLLSRGGRLLLFSNYRPGDTLTLDLAEIYWKDYSIVSAYNPTYAPYTANAEFMLGLDLESLIGIEFPIEKINEAFQAYATHQYQKILVRV